MMRKRTYASRRTGGKSGPKPKRQRTVQNPFPRFKALANPMNSKIANQMRCEFTYAECGVVLNPGVAGGAASFVFAANGLYDPNISGGGHQPMGYDQMMGLYNQYIVIGGYIKVTFSNTDATNSQMIGVILKDSPTTSTDPRSYIEWGNGVWSSIAPRTGGPSEKTMIHKFDIAKYANQDIFNEQSFTGSVASNPANTLHLIIWACPSDNATDSAQVNCNVEICYDTIVRSPGATALS